MTQQQNEEQDHANYSYAQDLGGLELLQANFHHQCFSRHVHEGYCIGVIESGAQRFYRSGGNHIAARDSIILVNADQVHDGHRATENGWSYQAMYPIPAMLEPVFRELRGPGAGMPYFSRPVVSDPLLANQIRYLFRLLSEPNYTLERETYYLALMSQLIQRHGSSYAELPALGKEPVSMNQVREYLDANFTSNISVQTLATLVGLNPFYLTRLFQKTYGLPPHAYQVQCRIHLSKQLLRRGLSLSEIALQAGFTDQSHLNRHFKRHMGVTPGSYKRSFKR